MPYFHIDEAGANLRSPCPPSLVLVAATIGKHVLASLLYRRCGHDTSAEFSSKALPSFTRSFLRASRFTRFFFRPHSVLKRSGTRTVILEIIWHRLKFGPTQNGCLNRSNLETGMKSCVSTPVLSPDRSHTYEHLESNQSG